MNFRLVALGGLAALVLSACGEGRLPSTPVAKTVTPIPFSLVSHAGRQAASQLYSARCPKGTGSCGVTLHSEPRHGSVPGALSVVRPGEHVRIAATQPIEFVVGFATRLCIRSLFFGKGATFIGRDWTIRLAPGRYVVSVSFFRRGHAGTTTEDGLVGLLVSKMTPLGILRHPSC